MFAQCPQPHLAVLHNQDPVRIHDSVEPVCDGKHRATRKFLTNSLLRVEKRHMKARVCQREPEKNGIVGMASLHSFISMGVRWDFRASVCQYKRLLLPMIVRLGSSCVICGVCALTLRYFDGAYLSRKN